MRYARKQPPPRQWQWPALVQLPMVLLSIVNVMLFAYLSIQTVVSVKDAACPCTRSDIDKRSPLTSMKAAAAGGAASAASAASGGMTLDQSQEDHAKIDASEAVVVSDGWSQIDVFFGERDQQLLTRNSDQKWFSQVGQDRAVLEILSLQQNGYFIDLAANDATKLSNTYALETFHGWKGLCIEPNPKYWARLAYRKCNVVGAVVGQERLQPIDFNFGKKGSELVIFHPEGYEDGVYGGIVADGFDNKRKTDTTHVLAKRYTVTLQEIFDRYHVPKIVDYLSLDVEGAEFFVMSAFPLDDYKIRILSVERPKEDLKRLLSSKGYTHIKNLGKFGEELWGHSSDSAVIVALAAQN